MVKEYLHTRSKFLSRLAIKGNKKYTENYIESLEDVIDMFELDVKYKVAARLAYTDISLKSRLNFFDRDIVKLSYYLSRPKIVYNGKNDDGVLLHLVQRIANIYNAVEEHDANKYDSYSKNYKSFRDKLFNIETKCIKTKEMWEHLHFLCIDIGSLQNLTFYLF